MESMRVQGFIAEVTGKITSPLWKEQQRFPDGERVRICEILEHNHAFERYVVAHPERVSDFQFDSVMSMLSCTRDECGGIMYACTKCNVTQFIPFRCHSRVCPRCGKRYAEQWGRMLMARFFRFRIVI